MILAPHTQPHEINEEAMVAWAIRRLGLSHILEREDALQEGRIALARAMQTVDHTRNPHEVRGYLFQALRNRMIFLKRSASAASRTGYEVEIEDYMAPAHDTDIVRRFEKEDAQVLIDRAPLEKRERHVLSRILDGAIERDVAKELGISHQMINVIKQKAIATVRRVAARSGE